MSSCHLRSSESESGEEEGALLLVSKAPGGTRAAPAKMSWPWMLVPSGVEIFSDFPAASEVSARLAAIAAAWKTGGRGGVKKGSRNALDLSVTPARWAVC